MLTISCIFCHQNAAIGVLQENGYEGKKCFSCNLIYVSPRPSLQEIANLYGHNQAHIPAHTHIAQKYPKTLHARHTLSIIKRYVSTGDLLEIGSGAGYFLMQAKQEGFSPYGIELNPVQASFIKNSLHIPCLENPLDFDSFGDKQFDVIYHSDVLSHFYDPLQAMRIMHYKLKPGGYMIFETGNIADINPRYYTAFNALQYPDHLFFFGEKSLAALLNITDFKLKKMHTYSIVPQLKIMKSLNTIKNLNKHTRTFPSSNSNGTLQDRPSLLRGCMQIMYYSFMHGLRYTVGSFLPKKERPQTIIVIAQK